MMFVAKMFVIIILLFNIDYAITVIVTLMCTVYNITLAIADLQ